MKKRTRIDLMGDDETRIDNKDGVEFDDCFALNYYGVYVFLNACFIDFDQVAVYERAKIYFEEDNKKYVAINFNKNYDPKPLIVKGSNTWSKSEFYLKTRTINGKVYLEVIVNYGDELYCAAKELGAMPEPGIIYAEKLELDPKYGYCYKYEVEQFPSKRRKPKLNKAKNLTKLN